MSLFFTFMPLLLCVQKKISIIQKKLKTQKGGLNGRDNTKRMYTDRAADE